MSYYIFTQLILLFVIVENNKRRQTESILTQLADPIIKKTAGMKQQSKIANEIKAYQESQWVCVDSSLRKMHGPLIFFKENNSSFPILSYLARAIYCLMPTSTPIEGVFSGTGLTLTPRRQRMAPTTLEALTQISNNNN